MWTRLRNYFFTGLAVFAPIGVTVYLVWLFVRSVDGLVARLIPPPYAPSDWLPIAVPGLGLVIAVIAITAFGAFVTNFAGRKLLALGERLLQRLPVVRGIYGTVKQIAETVMKPASGTFRSVVLVEYPRPGLWAIAFVASEASPKISRAVEPEMLNIFLPTTPNPTSGFLLFVPRRNCIFIDMSVEEAIKYVISAGLVGGVENHPLLPDAARQREKTAGPGEDGRA